MMAEYRSTDDSDLSAIRDLLEANGWGARVADSDRFHIMLANSNRKIIAVDRGRIVGFARALCDQVSNGYISMVVVAESHRRRGIGREMIRRLMGDDPRITWVLRAGRGSAKFWTSLGFAASQVAMERTRTMA